MRKVAAVLMGLAMLAGSGSIAPARAEHGWAIGGEWVVLMSFTSEVHGRTIVSAWDKTHSRGQDTICASYLVSASEGSYMATDCNYGVVSGEPGKPQVVIDETLTTATVQGSVNLSKVGQLLTVDTTHQGTAPNLTRGPLVEHDIQPTTPQGTTQFLCFEMGSYSYTLDAHRDATVAGSATRANAAIGELEWADFRYYRTSHRQHLSNCR